MKWQSFTRLVIVLGVALASLHSHALTREDCLKRGVTAIENAQALGGSERDEQNWGTHAAIECAKELRSQEQVTEKSGHGSGPSVIGVLILIAIVVGIGWVLFTFMSSGNPTATEEQERMPTLTPEEREREEKLEMTRQLREELVRSKRLGSMTVKQITEVTKASSVRSTSAWLQITKLSCLDYPKKG